MDVSPYRFCPICGGMPLSGERGGRVKRCRACGRTFHSAPHAAVGALIVDDDQRHVLLARRGIEPFKDSWDIPGGFLEIGESLEDALRREVREELGIGIRIQSFWGSYPDVYGADATPVIAVFYVATIASGSPSPGSDVVEFRWFARDGLPPLAFENCRWAIGTWRERPAPNDLRARSAPRREDPRLAVGLGTILLIEDDDLVRELVGELLVEDGYTVIEAADPTQAFERAEQHGGRIDLLLTDVIMPAMSGRAAAQRIRAMHPDVQVLFISGYPEDQIEAQGVLEPGVAFLGKPFSPHALRQKVREVLEPKE